MPSHELEPFNDLSIHKGKAEEVPAADNGAHGNKQGGDKPMKMVVVALHAAHEQDDETEHG